MSKEYSYRYEIYDVASEEYFKAQCAAIEKYIPDLQKDKLLEDVDGSLIQVYHHSKGDICIFND